MGVMAYVTKHATRTLSGAQVAFVRFAIGLVATGVIVAATGTPVRMVRKDLVFLRGAFGGFAVLLFFLAIAHLPVGTATLLNFTYPIFSAAFAALFLGEALGVATVTALAAAGAGVTLVIYGQGKVLGGAYVWQAVGLTSAVLAGAAVTSMRAARSTDSAVMIFGSFCLVGVLCTAPPALLSWHMPAQKEWILLVLIGSLATVGQLFLTHALGAVDAATSGVISQMTVITAMVLGCTLDGEPFGRVSLAGVVLTLAGVTVSTGVRRNRT
jgi:drug/metabolite transporter (DMT)-like permease